MIVENVNVKREDAPAYVRQLSEATALKQMKMFLPKFIQSSEDRIKKLENSTNKTALSKKGVESLASISSTMSDISQTLKSMSGVIGNVANELKPDIKEKYDVEEAKLEEKSGISTTATNKEGGKEVGFFDALKSLFTNPAVLAAVAGIVYAFLPKSLQDKIKAALGGFIEGIEMNTGPLDEMSTGLKIAGVAIATYFTASIIEKLANAVTMMIHVVRAMKSGIGRLRKLPGAAKFALGAAVGVGTALVLKDLMDEDVEDEKPKDIEPEASKIPKSKIPEGPSQDKPLPPAGKSRQEKDNEGKSPSGKREGTDEVIVEKRDGTSKKSRSEGPPGSLAAIREMIADAESGGDYNIMVGDRPGGKRLPLTDMTIAEIFALQKKMLASGRESTAVGKYQIVRDTLQGLVKKMGIDLNTKFNESTQDTLANELIKQNGYEDYKSGQVSAEKFLRRLARTFAGLPTSKAGLSAHEGIGSNKATITYERAMEALRMSQLESGNSSSVASGAGSGSVILASSERVNTPPQSGNSLNVNNMTSNKADTMKTKKTEKVIIPSPVADRGSLVTGSKFEPVSMFG